MKFEKCNFTTCRYNAKGKCQSEENRKECVEVSKKVLCLDKKSEKVTTINNIWLQENLWRKREYRYAVVSVRSNMPICLCSTYESAKDDVKDYRLYNAQLCKIIDLEYYNPYN